MTNDWQVKWLEKDLESMGKRLGVVLDDLNKKKNILQSINENIEYALTQRELDYGMPEEEAIKFRMRKVFSILEEIKEDIQKEKF